MKISLILPLREQHQIFRNLMRSVMNTAKNLNDIEVLIVIDDDYVPTILFAKECIERYTKINLKFLTTKRSIFFSRDYYNFAEKQASGRWILGLNADSFFKTKEWDVIIDKKMSDAADRFGDDIISGIVDDGLLEKDHSSNFSCWTLTSKEYVNLMGGVTDKRIPCWGADVAFGILFNLIDEGKRKVNIREVFIDHLNNHVHKNIPIHKHTKQFHQAVAKYPNFLTDEQLKQDAEKVNNYIENLL